MVTTNDTPEDNVRRSPFAVRRSLIVVCLIAGLTALGVLARKSWQPLRVTVIDESISIDDELRTYRLVVPQAAESGSAKPVVFALHGALNTTAQMAKYSQLDRLAEENGFLLVYLPTSDEGSRIAGSCIWRQRVPINFTRQLP